MGARKFFGRPAARRFNTGLVAVLLFGGWLAAFTSLLRARPLATIVPRVERCNLLFSPDNKVLVTWGKGLVHAHGPLQVWSMAGEELFAVADAWDAVQAVSFSNTGTLLAARQRGSELKIWDFYANQEYFTVSPPRDPGLWIDVQFSADNRYMVVHQAGGGPDSCCTRFFDLTLKEERSAPKGCFSELRFFPGPDEITTCEWQTRGRVALRRWRLGDSGPFLRLASEHSFVASELLMSPDGRTVATVGELGPNSNTNTVQVRETASGRLVNDFTISVQSRGQKLIAWSPDGRLLVVSTHAGHDETQLWDVSAERAEMLVKLPCSPLFAPSGERFLVRIASGVEVYAAASLTPVATLAISGDHSLHVMGVTYLPTASCSPDGRLIAVGELFSEGQRSPLFEWIMSHVCRLPVANKDEAVVRIWNVEGATLHASLNGCTDAVFSPNSKTLAALRSDGTIDLWDLPINTASNSWWTITAAAIAATLASLAVLKNPLWYCRTGKARPSERGSPERRTP